MNASLAEVMHVLGGKKTLKKRLYTEMDIVDMVNHGVTKNALMNLSKFLSMSLRQIISLLPVTERTIQRYNPNQHLDRVVSEHIIQIAEVAAKGVEVFKNKENFLTWLNLPNKALANKTPLSLLKTTYGKDMVLDVLVRIEHGVFS